MPELDIHTKCGLRFLPLLHPSYTRDRWKQLEDYNCCTHRRST